MPGLCPKGPAPRAQSATESIAALAASQHGAISRTQLLGAGVSASTIYRWVAADRLHRVHPGVYALGHPALPLHGRLYAALLYAGEHAVLSHTTAAWCWRLLETEPRRIHVAVPGRRRSLTDVCVHRTRSLESSRHRGMPVTTVARTLLDVAAVLRRDRLERMLAEADYRRLLDPDSAVAILRSGHPGSGALRVALATHRPGLGRTRSVLEQRFVALCMQRSIPLPEINVKVRGLMVDALWRNQRVIVELDGHAAHSTSGQMERDRRRELILREAGYRVLRYTWSQVVDQPDRVVRDLRLALSTSGLRDRESESCPPETR